MARGARSPFAELIVAANGHHDLVAGRNQLVRDDSLRGNLLDKHCIAYYGLTTGSVSDFGRVDPGDGHLSAST